MSPATSKTLIASIGDRTNKDWQESWRVFVELYTPLLARYVVSIGQAKFGHRFDDKDVADVTQDILIHLCGNIAPAPAPVKDQENCATHMEHDTNRNPRLKFVYAPERGKFRSWLYRVTFNCVVDHLRKRKRIPRPLDVELNIEAPAEPPDEWVNDFRRQVLARALPEVKATVSDLQWYCFEQFYLKNRKAVDVANDEVFHNGAVDAQKCVNVIRQNVHRVFVKLRAKCEEYMEDLQDE